METVATSTPSMAALAGKYLTFVLGRECYGIPVLKVREIIRLPAITAVPQMPGYVKGVINLRGKIIPVMNLCLKFGLEQLGASERTCIIVVQITGPENRPIQLGLIVDAVEEVCHFSADDIEATPEFGAALDTQYILGMAKAKDQVKTLLDLDRVLGASGIATAHVSTCLAPGNGRAGAADS